MRGPARQITKVSSAAPPSEKPAAAAEAAPPPDAGAPGRDRQSRARRHLRAGVSCGGVGRAWRTPAGRGARRAVGGRDSARALGRARSGVPASRPAEARRLGRRRGARRSIGVADGGRCGRVLARPDGGLGDPRRGADGGSRGGSGRRGRLAARPLDRRRASRSSRSHRRSRRSPQEPGGRRPPRTAGPRVPTAACAAGAAAQHAKTREASRANLTITGRYARKRVTAAALHKYGSRSQPRPRARRASSPLWLAGRSSLARLRAADAPGPPHAGRRRRARVPVGAAELGLGQDGLAVQAGQGGQPLRRQPQHDAPVAHRQAARRSAHQARRAGPSSTASTSIRRSATRRPRPPTSTSIPSCARSLSTRRRATRATAACSPRSTGRTRSPACSARSRRRRRRARASTRTCAPPGATTCATTTTAAAWC